HKIVPFPVVLYKSEYWKGWLDWMKGTVLQRGFISEKDLHLLMISDDPGGVAEVVQNWYIKHEIVGKRAIRR
ncbi:MAG: TIGR00730 family Rossman fold protein, partial [Dehalococcoidia bacterium]